MARLLKSLLTLTVIISLCAILLIPTRVYAAESEGWGYTVSAGTATITYYSGSSKNIVIPTTIKGIKVTKIAKEAFCMSPIESVTIPGSIKSIGQNAFQQCKYLKSVTIQNGVEAIEKQAFLFCESLKTITIPDSVTAIGEGAFSSCPLLTEITLPKNIKEISIRLFEGAKSLTSVIVPDGVTSIGAYAFLGCSNLKTIVLPDSLEKIGKEAFSGTKIEELNIPEGAKSIEHGAFTFMLSLKEVKIPESWTSIDFWDFRGCGALEQVYIPDSIKTIGQEAFSGCNSLKSITIPSSVKSIGEKAFSACNGLTTVYISSSVENIAPYTFAFSKNASIIVDEDNPFYSSENGALYNKAQTKLLEYPSAKGDVVVKEGVTEIGEGAFYYTVVKNLKLPTTLKTIGKSAFQACTKLYRVEMPSAIAIGDSAFVGCLYLSDIELPGNLQTIGRHAFHECLSLASITIPGSVVKIGEYAFGYQNSGGTGGGKLRIESFFVVGVSKSAAQTYAEEYKLSFRPLTSVTMEQAEKEAWDLNMLGLLAGTGNGFDLDSVPTRLQGIIMLTRMMGEENDAKACTYTHPFSDVPAWGDRYVAWAYHKKYTNGTSATTFSSNDPMTAQQYLTFMMRALGYGNDVTYQNIVSDARKYGLIPSDAYGDSTVPFLRADMVHVTYLALQTNEKTTGGPLYMYLISKKAIDANKAYLLFNPELVDVDKSEILDFLGYGDKPTKP